MNTSYGRDLDLNLLRVFAVVADTGSVTEAASRLYLTQPAVSAALGRLGRALGEAPFARRGRGLVLTSRGERLAERVRELLPGLVDAVLAPDGFDPATSDRTIRLGLADAMEGWLVPGLLASLRKKAPNMRLVALPIQFRTVAEALTHRTVDMAVTVADDLPPSILRENLFVGDFVCVFDPRHARVRGTLREATYFAHEHVIVSYAGDLRGVVEDALGKSRNVRCSVSTFANVGDIVLGSPLLATVPRVVAKRMRHAHPRLRTAELPFAFAGAPTELLWSNLVDGDAAGAFVRDEVRTVARAFVTRPRART
ncbi:MAG: LysR family transcriptional regulator [Polyangiaceae bacterium]